MSKHRSVREMCLSTLLEGPSVLFYLINHLVQHNLIPKQSGFRRALLGCGNKQDITWAILDVPVLPVYPTRNMYELLCPSHMLVWFLQPLPLCFRPNALFGMGNPLLDISAVVDKDFLDK